MRIPDVVPAKLRDPFAPPDFPGNRWLKYGCDAGIPKSYTAKLDKAVQLAYELNERKKFVESFVQIVSKLSHNEVGQSVYLHSLSRMVVNSADGSTNPIVVEELRKHSAWLKQATDFRLPGAFTYGTTGQVWIREFALRTWSEKQLAGLLSHEATHVAGAPGGDLEEALLATLYAYSYPPPEQ